MIRHLLFLSLLGLGPCAFGMEGNNDPLELLFNITSGLYCAQKELFEEVLEGNAEAVARLLDEKTSPNICNSSGWTPLMIAGCRGEDEICRLLLEAGADPNACDVNKVSVLDWACASHKVSTCQLLLEAGAKVNSQDIDGKTPLMNAVEWSDGLRLVKLFLKYGANPEIQNKEGKRARECASDAVRHWLAFGTVLWPDLPLEDQQIIILALIDHAAIPAYLANNGKIRNDILKSKKNSRLKRLKADTENIQDALFKRELGDN